MAKWQDPKTKILYDTTDRQWSDDGGKTWYFTFRGLAEWLRMYPNAIEIESDPKVGYNEDAEREIFGETLDEEIPDDLWEVILTKRL